MMTHPGKKLMFMGSEIGQFREWDYKGEVEWFLLEYEAHAKLQLFFAEMNHFYLEHPALWEDDGSWDGFRWIEPDDGERSIISYRRIAENGNELITVINFTPASYGDFTLAVPYDGEYREVFNSDDARYGGGGFINGDVPINTRPNANLKAGKPAEEICPWVVKIKLPPLGAVILRLNKRRFSADEI